MDKDAKQKSRFPDLSVLRRCWPEYADETRTHRVCVKGVEIGGASQVIIAGPCAVESFDQTLRVARAVKEAGAKLLRGGAFKPRTSPHSFQGLGTQGLEILREVRRQTGLGIVTEVMDPRLVSEVAETADMVQVGSRSMQNFPLLTEVGRLHIPVLLKRGWSVTLEEWLCAAEYIANEGNRDIVLCERGIRSSCHWSFAKNVFDLEVIEPLKEATPLPVIGDPSHATRDWRQVPAVSRTALEAGVHGLLIEVMAPGADRCTLKCDGGQAITPEVLGEIVTFLGKCEDSHSTRT
jgi:3-deoxy-7-phosphoheptulonate synthase